MCGIFVSISKKQYVRPSDAALKLLKLRGPDYSKEIERCITFPSNELTDTMSSEIPIRLLAVATVLSLRGHDLVAQPLEDLSSGSFLCWNGEVWKFGNKVINGNDGEQVFKLLLDATEGTNFETSRQGSLEQAVLTRISSLTGPFAFVFYDAVNQRLYFGRDVLGRRSLLIKKSEHDALIISSLGESADSQAWLEIEANGVYMIDLTTFLLSDRLHSCNSSSFVGHALSCFPWTRANSCDRLRYSLVIS